MSSSAIATTIIQKHRFLPGQCFDALEKMVDSPISDLEKQLLDDTERLKAFERGDYIATIAEEKNRADAAERKAKLYFWVGIACNILCMFGGYLMGKYL